MRELLDAPGVGVEMDQTTLVRDTLDAAADIEDMLCLRHWELCVASAGHQLVTSDDPVVLDFEKGVTGHMFKSPRFGRSDTGCQLRDRARHLIVGYAFELKQRRRDFSREQVAECNTRAVWDAVRWFYFGGNEFDFIGPDAQLATGPAEVLRLPG